MLSKIGKKLGYKDDGFTIIEVMIVLAVAGLIMAIVLVAIPQLQRNQRNTARRDIIGRVSTEMNTYAGNNIGKIPTSAADVASVVSRYLTGVDYADPQLGTNMTITYVASAPGAGVPSEAALPAVGTVFYRDTMKCNGEALASGTARTFALWTQLEGGSVFCVDNE